MGKKTVALLIAIATVLIFGFAPAYDGNQVVVQIPVGTDTKYISVEGTGEYLGPNSFSLKADGGIYLLDTAQNKVLSYDKFGKRDIIYDIPANIAPAKISTGPNNTLFLLDVGKAIISVFDSNNLTHYNIENLLIDAVIDFGVNSLGKPYVVLADALGGKTYTFSLNNNKATVVDTIEGRLMPSGSVYKTTLIKDEGYDVGHACMISIYDPAGAIKKEVTLKSEHWVGGAQLLADLGTELIVQVHEFESDTNGTYFEDLIKKVDLNGNVLAISVLPKKYKYIQNDTIFDGASLLHLNTGKDSVKVEKVKLLPPSSYVSSLPMSQSDSTSTTQTMGPPVSIQSTLPYVNRSLIQTTVISYWSETWYCSQSNYTNTNPNWKRPRYITSYNTTYQCIPYNWGGWDAVLGFRSRQQNGETTGNISGYVLSNCCGVDCSGYVQRCWGINDTKHNTTMLDGSNISYRISADSLKFGDAWNSTDHIMVYHQRDGYGNYVLYEATQLNGYDRVAHTIRSASSVESGYHSIRRHNINEDV